MNTTASPFTAHSQVVPLRGIFAPRPVSVEIRHLQATTRADIDALADRMLAQERQHNLDAVAEEQTEARSYPKRIDRDND